MIRKFLQSPPLYFILSLIAIYLVRSPSKAENIYTALVLVFLGIVIDLASTILFIKEKTTIKPYGNPSKIHSSLVYSFSRNPIYLGMLLILIGCAIASTNFASALPVAMFFIIIDKYIIPIEEKNMEKSFGTAYLKYKEKVRRWI